MERHEKVEIVAALRGIFENTGLVVVTRFSHLSVAEATDLRRRMRGAGATFRVTKNRLAKRAVEGTPFAVLAELFAGSSAIAYSDDPVAAARAAVDYARDNDKLIVLGGALAGDLLDRDRVHALAELPSLDALRARLMGLLNRPATGVAGVLQAPAGQLARILKARADEESAAENGTPPGDGNVNAQR